MGVINSELARIVTMNGPGYSVTINPGLNTIKEDELKALKKNERFRDMVDRGQVAEVKQQKATQEESGPPKDVNDIDITAMNVKNGRDVIDSCVDTTLLDKWYLQETEQGDDARKGILEALAEQRIKLDNLGKTED